MGSRKVKELENSFDQKATQQMIESQHKTITELCKLNDQYKSEIEHLKKLLSDGTPLLNLDPSQLKPEEIIAETQLNMLKEQSFNRTLTLEETKRVEIFHKILQSRYKNIQKDPQVEAMTADELIKALSSGDTQ